MLIAMEPVGDAMDRRRRLTAVGRHSATRWCIGIKLAEDPADGYTLVDVPEARNGEIRRQQKTDDSLSTTGLRLGQMKTATAKQFSERWAMTESTAKRHLKALEEKGGAWSEPAPLHGVGGRPPTVWTHGSVQRPGPLGPFGE